MKTQSSEEIVAQCIMERFPAAELATEVVKRSKVFIISHRGKLVVTVDRLGTKFLFPTRGPSSMKWSDGGIGPYGGPAGLVKNYPRYPFPL